MIDTPRDASRSMPPAVRSKMTSYRETFIRDGVVHIPGALVGPDLALARELFDWTYAHHSKAAFEAPMGAAGETVFIDTYNVSSRDLYHEKLRRSSMPEIAATILGADRLWFLGEQIFVKKGAGGSRGTPWHQDSDMPLDDVGAIGMWMAFEELDADACLHFVPGTHTGPSYNSLVPAADGAGTRLLYPTASDMPVFPDIEGNPGAFDIVSWKYQPGDIIMFHSNTIHGGAPVPAGGERNTLCLRFIDANVRYQERPFREFNGNAAAEATEALWEGLENGMPVHRGRHFTEIFHGSKVAA